MPTRRVYLETFGCQMNELDSELVAGRLASLGYRFTSDPDAAEVILYNTCSVREQAEQKVWSRLGELDARKARDPALVVGVLGCMAERDGTDLIARMPVVDILCGPGELDKLPDLLDNAVRTRESLLGGPALPGSPPLKVGAAHHRSANQVALQGSASRRSSTLAAAEDSLELLDLSRAVSPVDPATGGDRRSAYVRITRGCNKFCTYCVVPFTRGAEIHRPPEHILDECKRLADAGVIEVTLLGQTVNHYRFEHDGAVTTNGHIQPQKGRTYKGSHHRDAFAGDNTTTFADLLYQIHEQVPGIRRLRFVTSYPRDFGNDVLEVMRDCPRLCRYLHVPAQSGSNRVLQTMNRGYTVEEYDEFLARAREILDEPDKGRPLAVSGDIIVGFPTETDEDFEATKALLRRARYKNCFIFKYSPRPGTVAYDRIPDDVPEHVKRARNNELLALQARISDEISREQVGRTFEVFVEGLSKAERKKAGMTKGELRKASAVQLTVSRGPVLQSVSDSAPSPRVRGEGRREGSSLMPTSDPVQLSSRTDGDLIVFFNLPDGAAPDDYIGRIVPVTITAADQRSLHGRLA